MEQVVVRVVCSRMPTGGLLIPDSEPRSFRLRPDHYYYDWVFRMEA